MQWSADGKCVFHFMSTVQILEWKEHEKRVAKKRLNFKLKWIMRKKNAGF